MPNSGGRSPSISGGKPILVNSSHEENQARAVEKILAGEDADMVDMTVGELRSQKDRKSKSQESCAYHSSFLGGLKNLSELTRWGFDRFCDVGGSGEILLATCRDRESWYGSKKSEGLFG